MTEDAEVGDRAEKRMKLRYAGTCRLCGTDLPAQAEAIYERATKSVRCVECTQALGDEPGAEAEAEAEVVSTVDAQAAMESGAAGSSARREYERRKAMDERRLREKWGRLGGIAVALSDERRSTAAWERGAIGEERLGARLDSLACDDIAVLHDRRIPGSTANIDHIVITRGGVWVIDAKRYKGRPELKIEGGVLRSRVEKLVVGRRDCTKLAAGVLKQADLVRARRRCACKLSTLLCRGRLAADRRSVLDLWRSRALAEAACEALGRRADGRGQRRRGARFGGYTVQVSLIADSTRHRLVIGRDGRPFQIVSTQLKAPSGEPPQQPEDFQGNPRVAAVRLRCYLRFRSGSMELRRPRATPTALLVPTRQKLGPPYLGEGRAAWHARRSPLRR